MFLPTRRLKERCDRAGLSKYIEFGILSESRLHIWAYLPYVGFVEDHIRLGMLPPMGMLPSGDMSQAAFMAEMAKAGFQLPGPHTPLSSICMARAKLSSMMGWNRAFWVVN